MTFESPLKRGERRLAHHIWKAAVLRGLFGIVFAVVVLVWPSIGLATITALFGAYALLAGTATVVGAFRGPARGGERAWLALEGFAGIAVGLVVLVWPNPSALALLYLIAAWAIAVGVLELALTFALPFGGGRSLLLGLGGLVSIAFGVIMFAHPGTGAAGLLALIAAFAFVTGVMQVAFGLELRHIAAKREDVHLPRPGIPAAHRPALRGT